MSHYDAYVSHAEADREWVEEVLAPRLRSRGYRPFLEDDLPLGAIEIEARSQAVSDSRKVLLVLSRAYLESRWSLLEDAIAQSLDPAARKRKVIPILRDDCPSPLHVRPLVAVDLRKGDPRQWQRLVDALDPERETAPVNPVQRLSLQISAATSNLPYPSWNFTGLLWLLWLYLLALAAASLLHVVLWQTPTLRNTLTTILLMPTHGLAYLVWREDRDIFRRLSHILAKSRLGRGAVAGATAGLVWAWWIAGVPIVRDLVCGPFGCREAGTTYLTINSFEAKESVPDALDWAEDARLTLEQKLSSVGGLRVIGTEAKQLTEDLIRRLDVDYTLFGTIRGHDPLIASVSVTGRHHEVGQGVQVRSRGGRAGDVERLALHQRLAVALLDRMGVTPSDDDLARMAAVPTASPEAWGLAQSAWEAKQQGRFDEARASLGRAVEIDPCFAAAWSNLAEISWRQGRFNDALAERREAVTCLPEFAPFRYNLGHLLAYVGRDDEALVELRKAAELDPAHGPTYNELGNLWLRKKSPAKAAEALERGRLAEPRFAPLAKNLGRTRLALDQLDEAVHSLEDALRLYARRRLAGALGGPRLPLPGRGPPWRERRSLSSPRGAGRARSRRTHPVATNGCRRAGARLPTARSPFHCMRGALPCSPRRV